MRKPTCPTCGRPQPIKPNPTLTVEDERWWLSLVLILGVVAGSQGLALWWCVLR